MEPGFVNALFVGLVYFFYAALLRKMGPSFVNALLVVWAWVFIKMLAILRKHGAKCC